MKLSILLLVCTFVAAISAKDRIWGKRLGQDEFQRNLDYLMETKRLVAEIKQNRVFKLFARPVVS